MGVSTPYKKCSLILCRAESWYEICSSFILFERGNFLKSSVVGHSMLISTLLSPRIGSFMSSGSYAGSQTLFNDSTKNCSSCYFCYCMRCQKAAWVPLMESSDFSSFKWHLVTSLSKSYVSPMTLTLTQESYSFQVPVNTLSSGSLPKSSLIFYLMRWVMLYAF